MPNRDLKEQLRLLCDLQELDLKILSLNEQLELLPTKITKLEENLKVHEQALEAKREELAQTEKELRSRNADLADQEQQKHKYQAQLRQVKTNKEYQALDKEIGFLEEKEAEVEDAILDFMLRIDKRKEELLRQQKLLDGEKKTNRAQQVECEREATGLLAEVGAYQEERNRFSSGIDEDLATGYEAWGKRNNTAFVSIVSDDACSSCRISIPPQALKEARKYERIVQCSSCKRILYPLSLDQAEAPNS